MPIRAYPGPDYFALPRTPRRWLVQPVLPVGGSVLLYGEAKAGKSYLTLDLACAVATGRDWLGWPCREPGRVAYVQLDTPSSMWAGDPDHYLSKLLALGQPVDQLIHIDQETLEECYPFNILDPNHAGQLQSALAPYQPDLVVIDTLREVHEGDENDSQAMRQVVGILHATLAPAAMILVHHAKKPNWEAGEDVRNDMRGGYIAGRVDTMFKLNKHGKLMWSGRGLVDDSMTITSTPNGSYVKGGDPAIEELGMILDSDSSISDREAARQLAKATGKKEETCRNIVRRYRASHASEAK